MIMNTVVFIFLAVGLVLFTVGYMSSVQQCPEPKIEYRFKKRSFDEEQEKPIKVSNIFRDMFTKKSPLFGMDTDPTNPTA
jgi:hypothetical protein